MLIYLDIENVRKMERSLRLYKDRPETQTYQEARDRLVKWRKNPHLTMTQEAIQLIEALLGEFPPYHQFSRGKRWS